MTSPIPESVADEELQDAIEDDTDTRTVAVVDRSRLLLHEEGKKEEGTHAAALTYANVSDKEDGDDEEEQHQEVPAAQEEVEGASEAAAKIRKEDTVSEHEDPKEYTEPIKSSFS